mgnify:CR=1 FL=1
MDQEDEAFIIAFYKNPGTSATANEFALRLVKKLLDRNPRLDTDKLFVRLDELQIIALGDGT